MRDASDPFAARALSLVLCDSDEQWSRYVEERIPVEVAFGLDEASARALVQSVRIRGALLGMRLWRAFDERGDHGDGDAVGGIAAFRHPGPIGLVARLQEGDVFPGYRGQGYGAALLEGARRLLVAEGVRRLVIGADEDDWPLGWYRRLGFRDVARVHIPLSSWLGRSQRRRSG